MDMLANKFATHMIWTFYFFSCLIYFKFHAFCRLRFKFLIFKVDAGLLYLCHFHFIFTENSRDSRIYYLRLTKGLKSKDGKLESSLGFFYRIIQTAVPAPSSTSTASLCFLICSYFTNFAVLFTNVYFTFFLGHFIFLFWRKLVFFFLLRIFPLALFFLFILRVIEWTLPGLFLSSALTAVIRLHCV